MITAQQLMDKIAEEALKELLEKKQTPVTYRIPCFVPAGTPYASVRAGAITEKLRKAGFTDVRVDVDGSEDALIITALYVEDPS
jgi:hypothetical protein